MLLSRTAIDHDHELDHHEAVSCYRVT
jgi:hypothetical protein